MPVRELRCENAGCSNFGIVYEWFASRLSKPDPKCPKCLDPMTRLISRFNAPWTGTLDRFNESGKEPFQQVDGGHFAWRVKSSRLPDGGPEKVILRTHQDQKEFCKAEGLIMPDEINRNSFISPDGKTLHTDGIAGQWQRGTPENPGGLPWLYTEEE